MTGRDEKGKDEYDENGQKPETAKKIATGRDESGKRSTTKTRKGRKPFPLPSLEARQWKRNDTVRPAVPIRVLFYRVSLQVWFLVKASLLAPLFQFLGGNTYVP